ERRDAAEPGAEVDAGPLRQRAVDATGEPGLVHRLPRDDEAELDVPIRAARVLAIEDGRRVEVARLRGDLRVHTRRIEGLDRVDAGATREQPLPRRGDVRPERGDGAHPGDHDPTRS